MTDSPAPTTLDPAAIALAQRELEGLARRTPLWEVTFGGRRVLLKAEHMQLSGSFKLRGAMLASKRAYDTGARAVAAASGGNHGLAIGIAAQTLGMTGHVFVPASAPAEKVERIRATGASVTLIEGRYQDAADAAHALAEEHGIPFLPAFDHPDVILGQGTCAAEVLEERPDCDALVVAVGGGGLLAGTALAAAGRARVFGCEPTGIQTVTQALAAGKPVEVTLDSVTQSGLGASITAPINLAILQQHPVSMHLFTDPEILAARDAIWEEHRIALEPSAGAALALLLTSEHLGELPCVVLCGANSGWRADS